MTKFGKPSRKIRSEILFANPHLIDEPIFFLSTGRCGTEWFTHALKKVKHAVVFHDPTPNLSVQNKFMYNIHQEAGHTPLETAKQIFFAGREQHLRHAYKSKKRYIETNNHITFFAYSLAELFPTAKFIHLYRHPGEFVTSGINRGWFQTNEAATEKIISPTSNNHWENFSSVGKISWVWNETNQFIEDFKQTYPNRSFSFDFSKRDVGELLNLFQFLNIEKSKEELEKALSVKKNPQIEKHFPSYDNWNDEDKNNLMSICEQLSSLYQFKL
ncbi:sulfotransferase [Ekhidna sp.]